MTLGPVRGADLAAAIRDGLLARIVPARVAGSPGEAVRRMTAAFGGEPTRSGRGCAGIVGFREWLFDHTGNGSAKNALLLVAPHTHWDDGLPVVYRAGGESRYVVGPARLEPDALYRPVSFVFSQEGAIPYEWVDESIGLADSDLSDLHAVIEAGSQRFWRENWPLGVAINFRFKASLFEDRPVDTVEGEIAGDPNDQSEVLLADLSVPRHEVLQVAWHCYSDRCYGLTDSEIKMVDELRALSDTMDGTAWSRAVGSARPTDQAPERA